MLRLFWGDNRLEAEKAIQRALGTKYEVFEGEVLTPSDLPSIFLGTSLFGTEKRYILLKDLSENSAIWEKLPDFLTTDHEIVIWEAKLDKRSVVYKALKNQGAEIQEFPQRRAPEAGMVFNILDTALKDGPRAVKLVEQIELSQDPYMFFGLMVTQALKKFEQHANKRERALLKELSKLDIQMKTTSVEPWALVKSFLLRASML